MSFDAHIITIGNEKGGSGKSTTAMHVVVALLKLGRRVGVIDLDVRQRTLSRYIENRADLAAGEDLPLAMPTLTPVRRSGEDSAEAAEAEERMLIAETLSELSRDHDFIVIDCPGSDTYLSRLGHAHADTLVTPMNDSFVDFDLLGQIDPDSFEVKRPSLYSELVWDSRKRRAVGDRGSIDWIVMRNRMANTASKNRRRVAYALEHLAPRIGFRLGPGLGERVIYRELFPLGLTLLDLNDQSTEVRLTMSHIAARQEMRELIDFMQLPGLDAEQIQNVA